MGETNDEATMEAADGAERSGEHAGGHELTATADRVVAQLHDLDEKVTAMKQQRSEDPETAGDKILKLALPSVAGLVAGKVFQLLWDKLSSSRKTTSGGSADEGLVDDDVERGLWSSLVFAAMSAAFSAVISQLSDRGSKALVSHRQHKRSSRS